MQTLGRGLAQSHWEKTPIYWVVGRLYSVFPVPSFCEPDHHTHVTLAGAILPTTPVITIPTWPLLVPYSQRPQFFESLSHFCPVSNANLYSRNSNKTHGSTELDFGGVLTLVCHGLPIQGKYCFSPRKDCHTSVVPPTPCSYLTTTLWYIILCVSKLDSS